MIICKKCGLTKEDSEYYPSPKCKTGRQGTCKSCWILRVCANQKENRPRANAVHRAWVDRNRLKENARKAAWDKANRWSLKKRKLTWRLSHPKQYAASLPERKQRWLVSALHKPVVLKRDGYVCCLCQNNYKLQLHHILPSRYISDVSFLHSLSNLVTLCATCHLTVAHSGNFNLLNFAIALDLFSKVISNTRKSVLTDGSVSVLTS